ncbi:MAG TPA: hypothetical protein VED17_06840 [Nitrososphaerales archaeon]|nr:hypothetical protein [Nitrososphaerales archaeon]
MSDRSKTTEGSLTRDECEVVLKALGAYQIHLYDEIKNQTKRLDSSDSTAQMESNLITSAIKKIHRDFENLIKNETNAA